MKTRKLVSAEVLSTGPDGADTIKSEIVYRKDARVRGYYLSVYRCTIEEHDGHRSERFLLYGGIPARLLKETARFSAKDLAALIPDLAMLAEMRAAVLAKERP